MAIKSNIDSIPALLSPGELVINNEAADMLGRQKLVEANKRGLAMRQQMQKMNKGSLNHQGIQPKGAIGRKLKKDERERPGDKDAAMEGMEHFANGTQLPQGVQRIGNSYGRPSGYQAPPTQTPTPGTQAFGSGYVTHDIPQAEQDLPGASQMTDSGGQNWRVYAPSDDFTHTRGYANGTQTQQGVQPTPPPPPPNSQAQSAPTLEQAKRNFELQYGPVQKRAIGDMYAQGIQRIPDTFPVDQNRFGYQGVPSTRQIIPAQDGFQGVQPGRQMVPAGQLQGKFSGQVVPAGPLDNGYRPNWTPGSGQVPPQAETPGFADQAKARAQAYQARTAYIPPAEPAAPAPAAGGAASKLGGFARGFGTLGGLYTGYQAAKAMLPENPYHPIEDFVNRAGEDIGIAYDDLTGKAKNFLSTAQAATPQPVQQPQPVQAPPQQPLNTLSGEGYTVSSPTLGRNLRPDSQSRIDSVVAYNAQPEVRAKYQANADAYYANEAAKNAQPDMQTQLAQYIMANAPDPSRQSLGGWLAAHNRVNAAKAAAGVLPTPVNPAEGQYRQAQLQLEQKKLNQPEFGTQDVYGEPDQFGETHKIGQQLFNKRTGQVAQGQGAQDIHSEYMAAMKQLAQIPDLQERQAKRAAIRARYDQMVDQPQRH